MTSRWAASCPSWSGGAPESISHHGGVSASILVVDNYDSFVYNLVQYLQQLHAEVTVQRNDGVRPEAIDEYDGVLLSPGPGTPEDAGVCMPMVAAAVRTRVPLLGVCLGHQANAAQFGGVVRQAPELLHGKTSQVHHDRRGLFAGVPDPFRATRYHSLALDPQTVPAELEVSATTQSGVIMAVRHRQLPIEGVQFHPESVLTEHGHLMLANWLTRCGDDAAVAASRGLDPVTAT
jgi:para-aminobenzoate synthetase component 2